MATTFPFFSNLALELRDQIWHDALPDKFGPALYFYKKDCFYFRQYLESDEGYDPVNLDGNLHLEWRHDLLNNAQSEVPLLFVNREARRIALIWLREQGTRPFEPMCDALYVAPDKWDDFLDEPHDRLFEPDHFGQHIQTHPALRYLAVPEAHFQSGDLGGIFEYFHGVQVLLIVIGAQPDLQSINDSKKLQHRWEFESAPGGVFFWNAEQTIIGFEGSEHIEYEALYKLIKDQDNVLRKDRVRYDFEIRLVFAVRKWKGFANMIW